MFSVTVTGAEQVIEQFNAIEGRVHGSLLAVINSLALQLEAHVKQDKLEGQVLNKVTGKLQGSIMSDVEDDASRIIGRGYSSTAVNYAAIHEYGGWIPDRYPVNGEVLHWVNAAGQDVFAKFARGFNMPERSFLRTSLEDYRSRIIEGMTKAVQEAIK